MTESYEEKERQYVLGNFRRNFVENNNMPLIIYGLGKNTLEILNAFPQTEIVGLMDEAQTGNVVFGKKVLGFEEVRKTDVKTILIMARAANVPIIYRRIAKFTKEYGISVYDINGDMIELPSNKKHELPEYYIYFTEERFWREIANADVVSFDIFDTLLVRACLYPRDIFYLMGRGAEACEDIGRIRITAEQELLREGHNPTIYDIYERLQQNIGCSDTVRQELLLREIDFETRYLAPRKRMVDILHRVQGMREVYLTSDMYLPKKILMPILRQNGIDVDENHILISCEEGKSKLNGMFTVLRRLTGNKRVLHIGDNYDADFIAATGAGLESAFYVRSVSGMLEDSVVSDLLEYQNNIDRRKDIASFINAHFDDPFLLCRTDGRLEMISEYQLGYYFIAPLIICFMKWLIEHAGEEGIDCILLGSRDGYLIERMFEILKEANIQMPDYQYLYVSRTVCVLAGIYNEEDIVYAASLPFSGSVEEMLQKRFRIAPEQLLGRTQETDTEYVLKHKSFIYGQAEGIRSRYLKYLHQKIDAQKRYAFFDFISAGSCQMGLERILGMELTGLYFFRAYEEHKEKLKIYSMYERKYIYGKHDALVNNYFFMENIMTSHEATVSDFDEAGNPIFMKEMRTAKQFEALDRIHQGIFAAVKNAAKDWSCANDDVMFADTLFKFIDNRYMVFRTDYFVDSNLEDEFANRSFDVTAGNGMPDERMENGG